MTKLSCYLICLPMLAAVPLPSADAADARAQRPKAIVLCVPPGGQPTTCATLAPGSTLHLTLSPGAPPTLFFSQISQSRKSRLVRMPLTRASEVSPGVYRVPLPASLCAGKRGLMRYEVQEQVPGFNLRDTIQLITIAC